MCIRDSYISLASAVYELLFGGSRRKILDGDLLNCSFKLSLCDLLFVRDAERPVSYTHLDVYKRQ